jgi:hypothetical protein
MPLVRSLALAYEPWIRNQRLSFAVILQRLEGAARQPAEAGVYSIWVDRVVWLKTAGKIGVEYLDKCRDPYGAGKAAVPDAKDWRCCLCSGSAGTAGDCVAVVGVGSGLSQRRVVVTVVTWVVHQRRREEGQVDP